MPPSSYAQGLKHACMRGLRVLLQTNLAEEEKKKHTQRIEKLNIDKLFLKLATIDENTLQSYTVTFGIPGGQSTSVVQYTAVTKELAND